MIVTTKIRKYCIVGALYDNDRIVNGSPSLPPIIPKINTALKESIITLLTTDIAASSRIKELEETISVYALSDTVSSLREVKRLRYELDSLRANTIAVSRENAEKQVSNLTLCRGIENIVVIHQDIIAYTCPVIIHYHSGFHLGLYRIRITPANRELHASIAISRYLVLAHGEWSSHACHPHISQDGGICWGGFINPMQLAVNRMQLDVIISQVVQYLSTYNKRSPFFRLSLYRPGGSLYCGYRPEVASSYIR